MKPDIPRAPTQTANVMEPQIPQICCRLRACYRTQDALLEAWKFRSLEAWLWGAAPRPGREKFSLHSRHVCDVPKATR